MALRIVDLLFYVYMILIFVRIVGSWLPELQNLRIMQFVCFYTDPYLNLFRRIIPPLGMIDFSPVIAILCLGFIEQAVKYIVTLLLP